MPSAFDDAKKMSKKRKGLFTRLLEKQKQKSAEAKTRRAEKRQKEENLRKKEKMAFQKGREQARLRAARTRGSRTVAQPVKIKPIGEERKRAGIRESVGDIPSFAPMQKKKQKFVDVYAGLGEFSGDTKPKKKRDIFGSMKKMV